MILGKLHKQQYLSTRHKGKQTTVEAATWAATWMEKVDRFSHCTNTLQRVQKCQSVNAEQTNKCNYTEITKFLNEN